jgi:hypothetical protein
MPSFPTSTLLTGREDVLLADTLDKLPPSVREKRIKTVKNLDKVFLIKFLLLQTFLTLQLSHVYT